MNLSRNAEETKFELQISPLIDVVFLLLIYFVVTTELIKKEGDMSFMLPARVDDSVMITLPMEVVIIITKDGVVEVDGITFAAEDRDLSGLATQVKGLQAVAKSQGSPFFVNLLPDKGTLHHRVVDVMDACAAAEVESLSFSKAR